MSNTLAGSVIVPRDDALLHAHIEASVDGLLIVAPDGRIIYFNRRFAEIWKLPDELLEKRSDAAALRFVEGQLINPAAFYERVQYLYERPRETSLDLIELKDGRRIERYGAPVQDPTSGELYGRSWQFRDVTLQQRALDALEHSESRYRSLVENSPIGIWQTTPEGETLYLNRAMCDLFEIESPGDIAGKTYRDFYTAESIATVQREHARRRKGEASNYEVEIIGARGSRRRVMIYGAPIFGSNDQIASFIATIIDVTKERLSQRLIEAAQEQVRRLNAELEARVSQRTRELEETNAQLEAFCYTVSHDLKAPLRAICSFAEILEEDLATTLSEERLYGFKAISASARRMDQLLKDLLDFTRIARCELQLGPVDTAALLKQLVPRIAQSVGSASVIVGESLPVVRGHDVAMEQVFTNLVLNAQKFVRPNVPAVVRIWAKQSGERVRIVVEDNGIGIAPEHQERIFRVFERLHGQAEFPGTGVGLAIVKTYVEKMGGAVGVESVLGEGSRFWIELPVATGS